MAKNIPSRSAVSAVIGRVPCTSSLMRLGDTSMSAAARADDKGGKRTVRMEGAEFVRRFMQHILPTGIKRIRHYGVLASACKGDALARSRAALKMTVPSTEALACATGFLKRVARVDAQQCPCCTPGRLRVVESLAGQKRLPEPCATVLPRGRGPP